MNLDQAFEGMHGPGDSVEYGFGGFQNVGDKAFSAWPPGSRPGEIMEKLACLEKKGVPFRFLFPERYHSPSQEAQHLFQQKDIGTPIHLHVRVQAHPERLLKSGDIDQRTWLDDPILNRIPLVVWLQGEVKEARFLHSKRAQGQSAIITFRHGLNRMSVLEWMVSNEFAPGIADSFEATGSDGLIRVHGIWQEPWFRPRLALHRGPHEMIKRDLPRGRDTIYLNATKERKDIKKQSSYSYQLAQKYLRACELVVNQLSLK